MVASKSKAGNDAAKCVDEYARLKEEEARSDEPVAIDSRLENIVVSMINQCFNQGHFKQGLGIAIDTRRLDKVASEYLHAVVFSSLVQGTFFHQVSEAFERSGDQIRSLLNHAFDVIQLVSSKSFREEVLKIMVDVYEKESTPDYLNLCRCLQFLDDFKSVARILHKLLLSSDEVSGQET